MKFLLLNFRVVVKRIVFVGMLSFIENVFVAKRVWNKVKKDFEVLVWVCKRIIVGDFFKYYKFFYLKNVI